jgi:hypothetical protein
MFWLPECDKYGWHNVGCHLVLIILQDGLQKKYAQCFPQLARMLSVILSMTGQRGWGFFGFFARKALHARGPNSGLWAGPDIGVRGR